MLLDSKVKIKKNVLTREECAKIIAESKDFEYDMLKRDTAEQSLEANKESLDNNTVVESEEVTFSKRKVSQSAMEPVFAEWDGNPVYRCKVMKYEEGEFVNEHKDAQWMCLSNYWVPNTNKSSESLMVMPLNDNYEGGEFILCGEPLEKKKGSAVVFPSNFMFPHEVQKVTSGNRYSIMTWIL